MYSTITVITHQPPIFQVHVPPSAAPGDARHAQRRLRGVHHPAAARQHGHGRTNGRSTAAAGDGGGNGGSMTNGWFIDG